MASPWNYIQNGQTLGPVPEEQLKAMLAGGTLKGDDLVWREGMAGWMAARECPELAPIRIQESVSNPYAAPSAQLDGAAMGSGSSAEISPSVVGMLRQTKPWVRLLAVLGFIGIAFMVLASVSMLALGSTMGGGLPAGFGVAMMLGYLVMAGIQLPAAIFLNRYASRIGALVNSGAPGDLEEALAAQKSFWRYVGILTLIMLCLYVLVILIAIVAGIAGMSGRLR